VIRAVAFTVRYHDEWEEDLQREGLYGANFDTFWRPIEESLEQTPLVGYPILDGSGARGFLTDEEGWVDLPKLVIYFKVDVDAERVVVLGLDRASLPEDFPPADWA
jgi:hypothetical protein